MTAGGSPRCPGSCEPPSVGDRNTASRWQCCLWTVEILCQNWGTSFFSRKVNLWLKRWFSGWEHLLLLEDLSLFLGTPWWKERARSCRLSSDLHTWDWLLNCCVGIGSYTFSLEPFLNLQPRGISGDSPERLGFTLCTNGCFLKTRKVCCLSTKCL